MSRLRIGVLAPEFPPQVGGMPAYATGISRALAAGHDVVVYTLPERGDPSLPCVQRPILSRDLCAARERLSNERVDVWLALNAGCAALAPVLERPLAAVVHGNDFLSPWIVRVRPRVERLRHVRALWRWHRPLRNWHIRHDLDRGIRAAACLFANSRSTAGLLVGRHPAAAGKVVVVPPGIDERFFREPLRDAAAAVSDPFRVLTVTRLERWTRRKNVDGLLRAVARLASEFPVRCDIVGDGDDRARLEQVARDLQLAERVGFHGRLADPELRALFRRAGVFVLASRATDQDVEGFGIVYVEAAALGLPSICSREGGATDAVADGWSGIVLDESSPEAIAEGIRRVRARPEAFPPDRLRAFAERFTWARAADTMRSHLESAAGRVGRPVRAAAS